MKNSTYFLFMIFFYSIAFSQNSNTRMIDSLVQLSQKQKIDTLRCETFNEISRKYIYFNSEKGISYAKKALVIAQKNNWSTGIGRAYTNIGMHLVSKGNYADAFDYFMQAEKQFLIQNDTYNLAKLYNEIGILKANQSKYPEALNYFMKSLTTYERIKNKEVQKSIASCYENIGTVYNLTNSYDKAIYYYKKAISNLEKIKNTEVETAMNWANLGVIYQKQNQFSQAAQTLQKAESSLQSHTDLFALAFINSWLGSTYLKQKNYPQSIEKLQKALAYVNQVGDKELTTLTLQNLGYAQFLNGQEQKNNSLIAAGFEHLTQSLTEYKKLGNHEGIMTSYLYLSDYYTQVKEFEKALQHYQLYSAYNDSIYNFKNKQSLQNLEDQRTIELNKREIEFNKLNLAAKEKQKWLFVAGLLLLSIIGGLLFYQSRNRKKTNEKLQQLNAELDEANKAKTRFFSILNHDLRGPVANLVFFLQLQKESPELLDEESIQRMQDKTMTGAENLLNSMEDILQWSKSQMENFKPQPQQFQIATLFEDTQKHFSSNENIVFQFENPSNLTLVTDENYLKTIVRNLTGNAVKALANVENPTIVWKAFQENDKAILSITDNGKGASQEEFKALYDANEVSGIKTGLGLHLIRDLAKAINCEIAVDSKINEGTTITLKL